MTAPPADPHTPLPGTRPEGARDESEAAARVREMFSRIAPRYDFLNHLLSFSLDRPWRRRTAQRFRHILTHEDARVLDLCCGTGDLALALARAGRARVWCSDFAHPMLVRAAQKHRAAREGLRTSDSPPQALFFAEADALSLPFPDGSFDLITNAFGFRNLANYKAGLREMYRLLRPGGEVGILEFAVPESGLMAALYRFYFTQLVPRIGGAISGNRAAYSYLPVSVSKFPALRELHETMARVGFVSPAAELWTFGSVALHRARKP